MSYEKQNFVDGQVLTAAHMNHIENGIVSAESASTTYVDQKIGEEAQARTTAISTAIAQEVADRNQAIAVEKNNRENQCNYIQNTSVPSQINAAISDEADARNTAISTAIATEVQNRNSAISTAIATEVSNRNSAISDAISDVNDDLELIRGNMLSDEELLSKVVRSGPTVNLFNYREALTNKGISTSTGKPGTNNNFDCSDFIIVGNYHGKSLKAGAYMNGAWDYACVSTSSWAFYDGNENMLSGGSGNTGLNTGVVVPNEAVYFRFSIRKSSYPLTSMYVVLSTTDSFPDEYVSFLNPVPGEFILQNDTTLTVSGAAADAKATGDRLNAASVRIDAFIPANITGEPIHYIPLSFEAGTINYTTGVPEADPNNRIWRTGLLAVQNDRALHLESMQEISLKWFWFDAAGGYLEGASSWNVGNRSAHTVPTGAAFVRICALYASGSTYAAPDATQRSAILAYQLQDVETPKETSTVFFGAGTNSSTGRTQSNYSNIRAASRLIKVAGAHLMVQVPFGFVCTGVYKFAYDMSFIERDATEYEGIGKYSLASTVAYIRIIAKKTSGSFSSADLTALGGMKITFNDTEEDTIGRPSDGWEKLHISAFKQGATTASGYSTDSYRISSEETVGLPMGSHRILHGVIDSNYVLGMRCGANATNLSTALYFYTGEFDIEVPAAACYYRLYVARNTGDSTHEADAITPKTADAMGLRLWWKKTSDILTGNDEAMKALSSARLKMGSPLSTPNEMTLPLILHTSDTHGDYQRLQNFFDFADAVHPDVACVTGDVVPYYGSNGLEWFKAMVNASSCLPAFCVGNHETQLASGYPSDSDIYTLCFDGITTKLGNTTGKTWYYKDIAGKSLRIISINLYQDGSQTEEGGYRFHTHLLDDQISFLIDALNETPAGYGVILLSHSPQRAPSGIVHEADNPFFQHIHISDTTHNDIDGAPIYDIIDAFIGKTTISKTYTQKGTPSSLTVTADFSNVANGVEFIAHLNGHTHEDFIGYVQNATHKQLVLCVTCTAAINGGSAAPYIAGLTDQGRCLDDSSQDAFNAYAIDRVNKSVRVVRIGANMTYDLKERKHMIIAYAD